MPGARDGERRTLSSDALSSTAGKGSVAAMLGMVSILAFALGIELSKYGYFHGGAAGSV